MSEGIQAIKEQQDPAYSNFYNDYRERQNYSQAGSYFHKMDNGNALIKTAENAISIGLREELLMEYLINSSAWDVLTPEEKNIIFKHFKIRKERNEGKNKGNAPVLYKTRFTFQGCHYAEFADHGTLKFIKYKDGKFEVISEVKIPDPDDSDVDITVMPAPQIAQTKRDRILQEDKNDAVKFPPEPIEYGTEIELYKEMKNFIHTFMELKPEDEIILSLYVLKSSIFDALKDTSFPFIHILAPYGKGKSRLLTVLCEITLYGFYSVDIKSAALKRISDLYGAPLFVDEKGRMDNDLAAILNGKYNANAIVLNANNEIQQGFSAIIGYRIYGPLVLAGRTPFRDDAIESKSFQINMDFELTREDVPRKIKGFLLDEFTERARNIRGKLLSFRVKWHDGINKIESSEFLKIYEKHTEPRLFEVISFFEDLLEIIPEIKSEIGEVLKIQILRNAQVAAETPNGIIANEVFTLMDSDESVDSYIIGGKTYSGIYLSAIYDEIGSDYARQTGKILSALGLKTDRPRITRSRKGSDEKDQEFTKRYSMVRIPEAKKLNELKSRYDVEFVNAKLSTLGLGQQSILDDEDEEDDDMRNPPQKNKNKKNIPPFLNDSPHSPLSPEVNMDYVNSDVQNENLKNGNEEEKQPSYNNSDIIYRKSKDLAIDISYFDVCNRGGYTYYAIDQSKNDIKRKAWNSYMIKSQEITKKEFYLMKCEGK